MTPYFSKTELSILVDEINAGLRKAGVNYQADRMDGCPMVIIGDECPTKGLVRKLGREAQRHNRNCRVRTFVVVGVYEADFQKQLKKEYSWFHWLFPDSAPVNWDNGVEGNAVWLAEWLAERGNVRLFFNEDVSRRRMRKTR